MDLPLVGEITEDSFRYYRGQPFGNHYSGDCPVLKISIWGFGKISSDKTHVITIPIDVVSDPSTDVEGISMIAERDNSRFHGIWDGDRCCYPSMDGIKEVCFKPAEIESIKQLVNIFTGILRLHPMPQ